MHFLILLAMDKANWDGEVDHIVEQAMLGA